MSARVRKTSFCMELRVFDRKPLGQPAVSKFNQGASGFVAHVKGSLQVVQVCARSPLKTLPTLALIDSGSTNSWCDKDFANELGFSSAKSEQIAVKGLYSEQTIATRHVPL